MTVQTNGKNRRPAAVTSCTVPFLFAERPNLKLRTSPALHAFVLASGSLLCNICNQLLSNPSPLGKDPAGNRWEGDDCDDAARCSARTSGIVVPGCTCAPNDNAALLDEEDPTKTGATGLAGAEGHDSSATEGPDEEQGPAMLDLPTGVTRCPRGNNPTPEVCFVEAENRRRHETSNELANAKAIYLGYCALLPTVPSLASLHDALSGAGPGNGPM